MDRQDWYDMGTRIGDLVQSAIDSKDFKKLNESITDTINTAVNAVQYRAEKTAFGEAMEKAGYADRKTSRRGTSDRKANGKTVKNYKSVTFMAVGYTFAAIFGVTSGIFSWLDTITGIFGVAAGLFLVMAVGFLGMGVRGSLMNGRVKRLKQYLQVMGDRDTCTLEELAAGTGKSKKYVTKDIKKMIQDGLFPGGAYLDTMETCLMTSHSAYQQYQDTMKQYEQRRAEEARTRGQEESVPTGAELSREVQEILKEGRSFIAHIRECNDAIPGQEISGKLDRLENVVTRIFAQVEKDPKSAPDLHKMMSYYLPITRKLVDAYRDLDVQTVAGQNIRKTKQEIEASLDTINTAFENLLDSFFQDTAWDISSDISVLHTMMAQDGLMKRDFAPGESIKTVARDVGHQPQTSANTAYQPQAAQGAGYQTRTVGGVEYQTQEKENGL